MSIVDFQKAFIGCVKTDFEVTYIFLSVKLASTLQSMEMDGNFGQLNIGIVIKNIFLIKSIQNHFSPRNISPSLKTLDTLIHYSLVLLIYTP